jgi:Na+/H+ antiporter NhaA
MSLIIATLAFGDSEIGDLTKIGTLSASVASGLVGSLSLSFKPTRPSCSESMADDAIAA